MAKRKFDEIDAQCEREASAIAAHRISKPRIVGHRTAATRRMHSNVARTIQTKIEKRYVQ